ncbi:MAG: hypothetical protein AB7G48_18230 [Nitrospiraceae bacterium]
MKTSADIPRNRIRLLRTATTIGWIAGCLTVPYPALCQTLEETSQFLTDFTGAQAVIRALSCKEEDIGKLPSVTRIYAVIPTGANAGLIELNHGSWSARTGSTRLDLHDVEHIDYDGEKTLADGRKYQAVRLVCRGKARCVEKVVLCQGKVNERRAQFVEETLLFQGVSSAERATKALQHLQQLIQTKQGTSPF